jgi:hypothetical protein
MMKKCPLCEENIDDDVISFHIYFSDEKNKKYRR